MSSAVRTYIEQPTYLLLQHSHSEQCAFNFSFITVFKVHVQPSHLITYVLKTAAYPTHTSTSHLLRPSYSTDLSKVHPLYRSVLYKGTIPITSSHAHLSILKCCCDAYTCDRDFSTPSYCAYVYAPFLNIESTSSHKNSLTK